MPVETGTLSRSADLLETAWKWWTNELLSMVPPIARTGGRSSGVFVDFHGDEITIYKRRRGTVSVLERVRAGAKRPRQLAALKNAKSFQVAISADQAFVRQLDFPTAASANLRSVIALQIDRLSPVKADQIFFDHMVLERKPVSEKVAVNLAIVRRNAIEDVLNKVASWGVKPSGIGLLEKSTSDIRYNFLPHDGKASGLTTFRLNALLFALLVSASLFTWGVVQDRWQQDISVWQSAIVGAKAEAQHAADIERELNVLEQSRLTLIQQKIAPSPLAIMAELSRIIPKTAWVSEMRLQGTSVRLMGYAENAAILPELLEKSPLFANARFQSPVRQDPRQKGERYDLMVNLKRD